jgi:putative hydrolase of the HAD superfamily
VTPSVLPSPPGAIFFDAVGTLIHPEPPAPAVYAEIGRRFGCRLDLETIAGSFRLALHRQEEIDRLAGWRTDDDREIRRWRAIVADALPDVGDADSCFQALYSHFARPAAWRVHWEAGPTLRRLAANGWHVGLASNFDGRLRFVVAGLPELASVRTIVVSAEVGWRKPAAEFFQALHRQVQIAPEQTVVVGDDAVNDYDGACAAGLAAVLYDPRGACRSPAVRRVARLGDLLDGAG